MASILKVNTIQDATNSNTALSIDTAGRVTEPNRPAFLATYSNNAWSTVTNNDVVAFNDVSSGDCFDNGSNFVTGTNRFVAPVAGTYYFAYSIYTHNSDTTSAFKFRKNGSDLVMAGSTAQFTQASEDAAIDNTATGITVTSLAVSDYIQVFGAGSADVYGYYSSFCGHLVG
tara:strand:+ start:487 stop:1002 length:516 start_codon:yes stop_codon:yes gene_type:complete